VVLAIPKRIAQASLSVGMVPLVLLIVVGLIALCLVILGTRRRSFDERGPS
jgi:cell division protein FtsL